MTNIELYIDKKLCDIQSPDKLGVRLNRVLINPAELTTKDAQYSYSITIPATSSNDAIFGYANVEEVKNKFNHNYTAQLYVDSIRIFEGRFKLSEIDSDGNYKGNLVVPAKKTIKEIFGEKKMSEIEGAWELDVSDPSNPDTPLSMVEMLNKYNTDKDIPDCIFPLPLYGLLPKVELEDKGDVSRKTIWDKYVRLGIEDFPPSINCLETIKKIFKNDKNDSSNIGGSAFEDDRLKNLYMSYQNPTTYQQEWNWGHLGHFKIGGSWTNYKRIEDTDYFEKYFYRNENRDGDESRWDIYTANLLQSSMLDNLSIKDHGTNVISFKTTDSNKKNIHITIPQSGLYKINLDVSLTLRMSDQDVKKDDGNVYVIGENNHLAATAKKTKMNNFSNSRYEVKLLRDFGGGIDITDVKFDGVLYKNNLPQEMNQNNSLYFPMPSERCVQMIDPLQNELLIGGFRWGDTAYTVKQLGSQTKYIVDSIFNLAEGCFDNPYPAYSRILAIKNGWSWDKKYSQKNKIYSAINAEGYAKLIGEEYDAETDVKTKATVRPWDKSTKFAVELLKTGKTNSITNTNNDKGTGYLNQIIWLEKGEHLSLVTVSDQGHRSDGAEHGWMVHDIDFTLEVQPFKSNYDWITVDNNGTGTSAMAWDESSDFKTDIIDLVKFLPSEQKIDEWLDNFCKAFNLELTQPKDGKFELNVKQTRSTASAASVIDLDGKASIAQRTNQPLGLPSEFQLGFKINKEEEGYVKSEGNKDGGGSFITGNIDGQVVTQTSNFSYNWFKDITRVIETKVKNAEGNIVTTTSTVPLKLPVISHKEIWATDDGKDDKEMMKKLYTNYSQRFWYKNDTPDNVGIVWENTDKKIELMLPQLENTLNKQDVLNLDYYDNPNSILNTYFSIIATDDSNYTYVECYLNPDEYEQMDGTKLVKLNGDLYYVAAVEGYDPTGRNKTKLKLIRKV